MISLDFERAVGSVWFVRVSRNTLERTIRTSERVGFFHATTPTFFPESRSIEIAQLRGAITVSKCYS